MKAQKIRRAAWLTGVAAGMVMAVGGILTLPAAWLLERLPRRYCHYLLGGDLTALHSRVLGFYGGLALALVCASVLAYVNLCHRADFVFLRSGRGKALFVVLVVLALLTLSLAVNRVFWDDEIEHVHASWYVQHGQLPYRDFFEHHHPLLWILLAPLITLCGEGLMALAMARLLMLFMAAGIGWFTCRIARLAGGDAETSCLAVILLFSNFLFLPSVIEIRPDVPMVLLALAAVERLLAFIKEGKSNQLLVASFLGALSFLFLQKVIFLFPVAAVLLCVWRLRGKISAALFWKTIVVFLLPLFLFAVWLILSGTFHDYFLCNWLLNMQRQRDVSRWLSVGRMALISSVFWLSLLPALVRASRSEKSSAATKVVAWSGFTALAALFLLPNPADRHFLLPLPFLSAIVGAWAGDRCHLPFRGKAAKIYLSGLLIVPLPFLVALNFPLNGVQLGKLAYVLRYAAPGEKVLDGRNDFNLFRPDVHYFWFNVTLGVLEDYQRSGGGNRHADYDVCRLIGEWKPRFITLGNREWNGCGVWRNYVPTPYPGLFILEMDR